MHAFYLRTLEAEAAGYLSLKRNPVLGPFPPINKISKWNKMHQRLAHSGGCIFLVEVPFYQMTPVWAKLTTRIFSSIQFGIVFEILLFFIRIIWILIFVLFIILFKCYQQHHRGFIRWLLQVHFLALKWSPDLLFFDEISGQH